MSNTAGLDALNAAREDIQAALTTARADPDIHDT
jgi:hypothetical protein